MSATVPGSPIDIGHAGIVIGQAVTANDWRTMALAYDELVGGPIALIPMSACAVDFNAGQTITLYMRVWPRKQATHRMWVLSMGFTSASQTSLVTFTDPSGTAHSATVTSETSVSYGVGRVLMFTEKITSRTGAEATLTPTLYAALGDTRLFGIGCYELPRAALVLGGNPLTQDAGMEPQILTSGLPIVDDYRGAGAGYIAREIDYVRDIARRSGIFGWFGAIGKTNYFQTTSATFVNVLQGQPIALGRYLYKNETLRTIQLAAYASATAGGEIQWTMASGASVTMPIPAGSTSSPGLVRAQITVDCEDLTQPDGRRSSRDDTCTISARTVGGGTVTVLSLTAGEGPFTPDAVSSAVIASSPQRRSLLGRGPRFAGGGRKRA